MHECSFTPSNSSDSNKLGVPRGRRQARNAMNRETRSRSSSAGFLVLRQFAGHADGSRPTARCPKQRSAAPKPPRMRCSSQRRRSYPRLTPATYPGRRRPGGPIRRVLALNGPRRESSPNRKRVGSPWSHVDTAPKPNLVLHSADQLAVVLALTIAAPGDDHALLSSGASEPKRRGR